MTKRRTRKQKMQAKHQFTLSWKPESETSKKQSKISKSKANVKRQTVSSKSHSALNKATIKKATHKVKVDNLASIRHNMVKSISIAALILGLELMLYLFWR